MFDEHLQRDKATESVKKYMRSMRQKKRLVIHLFNIFQSGFESGSAWEGSVRLGEHELNVGRRVAVASFGGRGGRVGSSSPLVVHGCLTAHPRLSDF